MKKYDKAPCLCFGLNGELLRDSVCGLPPGPACDNCGHNVAVNAQRKRIPLTLCEDGMKRKTVKRRSYGKLKR